MKLLLLIISLLSITKQALHPLLKPKLAQKMSLSKMSTNIQDQTESRYPCGTCDDSVHWSHRGVVCETCGRWHHTKCQNIHTRTYENLGNSQVIWNCTQCDMPNYSSTAFDLFDIEQEEFESMCALDPDFNPLHTSTPTRAHKQSKHIKRPLRIININCEGVTGHKEEFQNLIQSTKPDIILGTESWLKSKHKTSEYFPENFIVYRRDRQNRARGGVFVAISDTLTATEEPSFETDCEILWTKIKLKGRRTLLISCFYHPETKLKNSMKHFLDSARRAAQVQNAIIVIGGDFNLPGWDWKTKTLKDKTKYVDIHNQFKDGTEDLGLEQMVEEPTRGRNTLDLFLTNQPNLVPRVEVLPGFGDHDAVYMELQIHPQRRHQPIRRIPLYKPECIKPLKEAATTLNNTIMAKHTTNSDPNDIWNDLKAGLKTACNDHVPHKTTKKKTSLPYIDMKTKKMIRRRDRVHKRLKKLGKPNTDKKDKNKKTDETEKSLIELIDKLQTEFRTLKKTIQRNLRRAHWQHLEGILGDTENPQKSTKKLYSLLKARRSEGQNISPLKNEGKLESDPEKQAEILNKHFSTVFNAKNNITEEEFEQRCPKPPNQPNYPQCNDIHITENGVRKLLLSLDPHKAPGPDGLTPKLLKTVAEEITPSVTLLYKASYLSGQLPSDWKLAYVSPIFKKGERYKASNYRPISLTCILCKLMEHIITSHLMTHLESNQILSESQHGFRRQRSCESQLLGFVDEVGHEVSAGKQIDTVVLDFAKAFDKVDHALLIPKLKRYGISGKMLSWIEGFLADRQQAVIVAGSKSSTCPVPSGVPQGSVLGPSLFLAYINDLPLPLSSTTRLFADDTMLHNTVTEPSDQETLQEDLEKLTTWEKQWNMQFHPDKCTNTSITRKKQTLLGKYTINNHQLENVTETKYLGVTIQENLCWNKHIQNTCTKANQALGFLRRNLKIGNKKMKENSYKTLVRPILEYACTVWDPYTSSNIQKLEKIQRRAARWVSHRFRQTSSVEDMLTELKWPTLKQRRQHSRLAMFYKYHNKLVHIQSRYAPTKSTNLHSARQDNSQAYNIPQYKQDYRQADFFPRTIPQWNHLPEEVVAAGSLDIFKSRLAATL